jgi:uncharacterized protein
VIPLAPHLIRRATERFALGPRSDHGPAHWGRVAWHGRQLAQALGVDPRIPQLFALYHDCCRDNEYTDPRHGHRAAELVTELARDTAWPLLPGETDWLVRACADHSEGFTRGPLPVQICWDADRLDLARVGIVTDPRLLCTELARAHARLWRAQQWAEGLSQREQRTTGLQVRPA